MTYGTYSADVPRRIDLVASLLAATLVAVLLLAGSGRAAPVPATVAAARPSATVTAARPAGALRDLPFAVGTRTLRLNRGPDRPLPTLVWYPATGAPGSAPKDGARPAEGRFPLVVYSHGLGSLPIDHGQVALRLAAAGFIVAAPAYPRTNRNVDRVERADVLNQPADASAVIAAVLALDRRGGDPFAGHLAPTPVGAVGHSAGGSTTNGLLAIGRDERIGAAVVIAGRPMGAYTGPAAPVLFVHGAADPVVTYDNGRRAYESVPWPKAFLTLVGQQHGEFLGPGAPGNRETISTIIGFLRWALSGDRDAGRRLTADATLPGVTRFENELGPI